MHSVPPSQDVPQWAPLQQHLHKQENLILQPAPSNPTNNTGAAWTWSAVVSWAPKIQLQQEFRWPFARTLGAPQNHSSKVLSAELRDCYAVSEGMALPKLSAEVPTWWKTAQGEFKPRVHLKGQVLEREIRVKWKYCPQLCVKKIF